MKKIGWSALRTRNDKYVWIAFTEELADALIKQSDDESLDAWQLSSEVIELIRTALEMKRCR